VSPGRDAKLQFTERWPSGRRRLIRNQVWAQVQRGFDSHSLLREQHPGEVAEWSKAHDWKSCVPKGTEGSNPSLSSEPHRGPCPQLRGPRWQEEPPGRHKDAKRPVLDLSPLLWRPWRFPSGQTLCDTAGIVERVVPERSRPGRRNAGEPRQAWKGATVAGLPGARDIIHLMCVMLESTATSIATVNDRGGRVGLG
jgi:hypothetical protein